MNNVVKILLSIFICVHFISCCKKYEEIYLQKTREITIQFDNAKQINTKHFLPLCDKRFFVIDKNILFLELANQIYRVDLKENKIQKIINYGLERPEQINSFFSSKIDVEKKELVIFDQNQKLTIFDSNNIFKDSFFLPPFFNGFSVLKRNANIFIHIPLTNTLEVIDLENKSWKIIAEIQDKRIFKLILQHPVVYFLMNH